MGRFGFSWGDWVLEGCLIDLSLQRSLWRVFTLLSFF